MGELDGKSAESRVKYEKEAIGVLAHEPAVEMKAASSLEKCEAPSPRIYFHTSASSPYTLHRIYWVSVSRASTLAATDGG